MVLVVYGARLGGMPYGRLVVPTTMGRIDDALHKCVMKHNFAGCVVRVSERMTRGRPIM